MTPSVLGLESRREELLAEVAILIYEQGLTQQEVAERIGVSRSTVSRLMDEARQRGIVQIYINTPFHRSVELQSRLCERFALREARVLVSDGLGYRDMLQRLGMSAAFYLRALVKNDMRVGVAWGTALYELVRAFRPLDRDTRISVIQIIGSIGAIDQNVDGANLSHDFAKLVRGRYYDLHAPLVVETAQLREALMRERDVADVLAMARQADIALVGIGSVETGFSSLVRAGYLSEDDLPHLRASSAVGDVCAHHFDMNGRELPIDLNQRVIGITLEQLKEIPFVVALAGGKQKAPAILGALRGGYLDVLITDSVAATEVLALDSASPAPYPGSDESRQLQPTIESGNQG
jgi:deoxyribonucleoside regulator